MKRIRTLIVSLALAFGLLIPGSVALQANADSVNEAVRVEVVQDAPDAEASGSRVGSTPVRVGWGYCYVSDYRAGFKSIPWSWNLCQEARKIQGTGWTIRVGIYYGGWYGLGHHYHI